MNTTQGLAVATALMLSAGTASATNYDNSARSRNSSAGVLWRNAPAEADSFATMAYGGSERSGFAPPSTEVSFADPAHRPVIEAPPPGGDPGSVDANPSYGLVPVPEPGITTMLLAGLGAIGLLGLRRRSH